MLTSEKNKELQKCIYNKISGLSSSGMILNALTTA